MQLCAEYHVSMESLHKRLGMNKLSSEARIRHLRFLEKVTRMPKRTDLLESPFHANQSAHMATNSARDQEMSRRPSQHTEIRSKLEEHVRKAKLDQMEYG